MTMGGDLNYPIWFWVLLFWSFLWKGLALWRSAQNKHKVWFVVIFLLNTFGILEIAYLFFISGYERLKRVKKAIKIDDSNNQNPAEQETETDRAEKNLKPLSGKRKKSLTIE